MINPTISEKQVIEFFDKDYDGLIDKFVSGFIDNKDDDKSKIVFVTSYEFVLCAECHRKEHKIIKIEGVCTETMKNVCQTFIIEHHWTFDVTIANFSNLKLLK